MTSKIRKFNYLFLITLFLVSFLKTNAQNGAALYQQNCAQCHGADLKGGNATSLIDGIWQFGAEDG
ncbi:MAG: cytochrome c, partial [Prolixibacteraceae bacterium]|nr:cytochrome c [Prolixibacteraceae bacterium]